MIYRDSAALFLKSLFYGYPEASDFREEIIVEAVPEGLQHIVVFSYEFAVSAAELPFELMK